MDINKKIELTRQNIWKAINDYDRHSYSEHITDKVNKKFVDRLAEDSVKAKQELRQMFRKSSAWNEELDALVINGTSTHDTNYGVVGGIGRRILDPVWNLQMEQALSFFTEPGENHPEAIDRLNELAPGAYAPGKKKSRIFLSLCKSLGVSDETAGSEFQRLYARFADELSAKKINFKLFVSLNPAHFITMSNPKGDNRGSTLTSCHSFNSTGDQYNNGCTGYARDGVTMIAFTVSDPDIPETLNNRKTTRQLFMYKPGNGLLLQSRMYNTFGGTEERVPESKIYRELIQKEISNCEDAANLWKTFRYWNDKRGTYIPSGKGFGGYPDWMYENFDAMLSIRNDCAETYKTFDVGTSGLCISCGEKTSHGLYCHNCDDNYKCCAECLISFPFEQAYTVYDRQGLEATVCNSCLDKYYVNCNCCDERYHEDYTEELDNDKYVCLDCLEKYYIECKECGKFTHINDLIYEVCPDCRKKKDEPA